MVDLNGIGGGLADIGVAESTVEDVETQARSTETPSVANGCFITGTMIDTDAGPVDVARLRPGDAVMTLSGPRALTHATLRVGAQNPVVRVRPGALASDVPTAELVLAADQQVMVQDLVLTSAVLVAVAVLVNAGSIQREILAGRTEWIALEFAQPELVLISGTALSACREPGQPASLRVLPPGPALFALRSRLTARVATVLAGTAAEVQPDLPASESRLGLAAATPSPAPAAKDLPEPSWTEDKPDTAPILRLISDGQVSEANAVHGLHWRFVLPAGSRWLRLASPTRTAGGEDMRRLGVAVLRMSLNGVPLTLTGMAGGAGFYPAEGPVGGQWRWTDGFAQVVLPISRRARVLEVVISNWHEQA